MMSDSTQETRDVNDGFTIAKRTATSDDLIDYIIDHAQQLASLALGAGRPQASALITLAVTELRRPG